MFFNLALTFYLQAKIVCVCTNVLHYRPSFLYYTINNNESTGTHSYLSFGNNKTLHHVLMS